MPENVVRKRLSRRQRPTLSGRTWGKRPEGGRDEYAHSYEEACFQSYQFDYGLHTRPDKVYPSPSAESFGLVTGDKSLGRHVERILEDCAGLVLARGEVTWPW
jgi:hypothetical protein